MNYPRFIPWNPGVYTYTRSEYDRGGCFWVEAAGSYLDDVLCVALSSQGDDYVGTLMYAGIPICTTLAGPGSCEHGIDGQLRDFTCKFVTYEASELVYVRNDFLRSIGAASPDAFEELMNLTDAGDLQTQRDFLNSILVSENMQTVRLGVSAAMFTQVQEIDEVILPVDPTVRRVEVPPTPRMFDAANYERTLRTIMTTGISDTRISFTEAPPIGVDVHRFEYDERDSREEES